MIGPMYHKAVLVRGRKLEKVRSADDAGEVQAWALHLVANRRSFPAA